MFLLGFDHFPATTGRFSPGHLRGLLQGVEGVLPLAWLKLGRPELTGPRGRTPESGCLDFAVIPAATGQILAGTLKGN